MELRTDLRSMLRRGKPFAHATLHCSKSLCSGVLASNLVFEAALKTFRQLFPRRAGHD